MHPRTRARLGELPEVFPLDRLQHNARPGRTWRYPGLKEHIALAGFTPDPGYLARAGIDASRPVVVLRPPADMALYHRFGNPLFPVLLERLASAPVTTILPARTGAQAADLEAAGFGSLLWHGQALDGRRIVAGADAVVSAGGSMSREAAMLGTPAWSIYAGRLAAVDRALVAAGSLHLLHDAQDLARIPLRKKPAAKPRILEERASTSPSASLDAMMRWSDDSMHGDHHAHHADHRRARHGRVQEGCG